MTSAAGGPVQIQISIHFRVNLLPLVQKNLISSAQIEREIWRVFWMGLYLLVVVFPFDDFLALNSRISQVFFKIASIFLLEFKQKQTN